MAGGLVEPGFKSPVLARPEDQRVSNGQDHRVRGCDADPGPSQLAHPKGRHMEKRQDDNHRVKQRGERIVAQRAIQQEHAGEDQRPSQGEASAPPPNLAIADQPRGEAYIIFDQSFARKFRRWPYFISTAPGIAYAYLPDYKRNRKDVYHRARSLNQLAKVLGMTTDVLKANIEEYNSSLTGDRQPITKPPFVALGPVKSSIIIVEGGVAIDERLRVLADDTPIPGLYGAGSAGQGGLLLEGHGHHLGWAFTSGRLAGRNAAYEVTTADTVKT